MNQVILTTGTSSGFGAMSARALAEAGGSLWATCCRRGSPPEGPVGGSVT
jgi:NADP-dependent 3-hydroxy acid dehydrogenase YdfG